MQVQIYTSITTGYILHLDQTLLVVFNNILA